MPVVIRTMRCAASSAITRDGAASSSAIEQTQLHRVARFANTLKFTPPCDEGRAERMRCGPGAIGRHLIGAACAIRQESRHRRDEPGRAGMRAAAGRADCASAATLSAPVTTHRMRRARSMAGYVSVIRRRPWYGPVSATSASVDIEHRVAGNQRRRVAIRAEPEMHEIEHRRQCRTTRRTLLRSASPRPLDRRLHRHRVYVVGSPAASSRAAVSSDA